VETRSLDGQVVLITGATSGIGAACARALTAAGARVAVGGRRDERLQRLAEEIGRDRVLPVRMDVRSPADSRRFAEAAVAEFGRVDALVANAGIGAYGSILDHSDDVLATMIDTNVSGTIWPIRAVLPHMLDKDTIEQSRDHSGQHSGDHGGQHRGQHGDQHGDQPGDIVIVASVAGLRGGGHEAVYAATKFAQVGLAGALDRELAPRGIRVSSICPAATRTEFAMGLGRTPDMPELDDWLDPEDVAGAVLTVLRQPRRLRTQLWSMWSMSEVG
jgi:NAD(P)-dependent dehydrogenase (short-subunit alcohol dehydrogenase family)